MYFINNVKLNNIKISRIACKFVKKIRKKWEFFQKII